MGKLVIWNMMTLDGYVEGANREIDWHEYVWGEELERFGIEQCRTAGALLFGRITYELMASHWPSATGEVADLMNSLPKLVFSRTLEKAAWHNTRLFRGNAPEEIAKLKRESRKDIFLFGSAELASSLIPNGLFDEFRIALNPLVLGSGNPVFRVRDRLKLRLLDAQTLKSGVVILRYSPI